MSRTQPLWLCKLAGIAGLALLLAPGHAGAVYLDEEQNWTFRLRAYSQVGIRLQNSESEKVPSNTTGQFEETQTVPETKAGQMIQNRFFANPELDVQLTPYTKWMKNVSWLSWLAPDDLRGRVAGWGFYDGVYDYGAEQFWDTARLINSTFNPAVPANVDDLGFNQSRIGGWYVESPRINRVTRDSNGDLTNTFQNLYDVLPGYNEKTPRTTYGYERRLNEFYLSYSKGPLFVRIGKQSLSWGESDTIALLDQTNPFSVLMGAPGFFQDIDEARLPLWTVRTSYNLFSTWGPFSSAFVEAYWVPGDLDVNTGTLPILTASPYSAPGADPGRSNPIFPSTFQFILVDQIPRKRFESSRYGFRIQTVVNRFLTLQAWFYRTYPQAPVPLKIGFTPEEQEQLGLSDRSISVENDGNQTNLFIVATQHKLTSVYGVAGTFFSEWLDGIVRLNAQLFENEPGFIPEKNLRIGEDATFGQGVLPKADIIRAEVGFDRFFFFRPLNPTNSFILSTSLMGTYNMDETDQQDFRFNGLTKPGIRCSGLNEPDTSKACLAQGGQPQSRGAVVDDYVQAKRFDAQGQITLQSDWFHGKLQPRLTWIQFLQGTWAVHPTVIYRWNDWLLFQADFQWVGGAYQSLGIFRDRGQISGRITYQLN
jgi:hypothetical protein